MFLQIFLPEFSIVDSGTKTVAAVRAGNDFISHTNSFNDKLNCLLKGTDGLTIHEIEGLYFFKYMLLKQAVFKWIIQWLASFLTSTDLTYPLTRMASVSKPLKTM